MRISQPVGCEVTTHVMRRVSGQFEVSIALWHVFELNAEQTPIQDSRILWKLAKQHWPGRALDEGFPKARAEFLCFGLAFPPENLTQGPFPVSVCVGDVRRDLAVYGQRVFGVLGNVQELAPPRHPVALSPENAFGGSGDEVNPAGIGYQAKSGEPAPSVQDPDEPITSPAARYTPAGFWPLPVTSPARKKNLGTFDRRWLQEDWPSFAPDTHMDFFQMAPAAQQLPAYFNGDEVGEIVGMHAQQTRMQLQLPGKCARCVYKRTSFQADLFAGWSQTVMHPETLYLFPNEGVGALLHRGVIQVERADALDLAEILLQLEPPALKTPASDIMKQFYRARWLQPTEPPASPSGEPTTTPPPLTPGSQEPTKRVTHAGTVKLWPEFEYVLSQPGITAQMAQAIRQATDPVQALAVELKRQLHEGRIAFEAALQESGQTEQDYLQAAAALPEVKKALGSTTPPLSLSAELGAMTDFIDTLTDNLRRSMPAASSTPPTVAQGVSHTTGSAPDTQAVEQMRQFIQEQSSQPTQFHGMNLSGLCLANLDLSGLDFSDSICEGTQFQGCQLAGANFKGAIVTRANFTQAQMASIDLSDTVCQQAVFDHAVLTKANLTKADLTDCSCRGTCFDRATLQKTKLNQSDLSAATFVGIDGTELACNQALVSDCDFTDAQLERADFMKAKLSTCKFQNVVSNRLEFSGATIKESQFVHAVLRASVAMLKTSFDGCRFENSDLSGSNWTTAEVSNTLFLSCNLSKLDCSSGALVKTRLSRCQATGLSLFSCVLKEVHLVQNNLMQASFHGAVVNSASMVGNNMYGADFTETKFDGQTEFEGNVTLNTSLVWRANPSA